MKNLIKLLIYKSLPSWIYYKFIFFFKKRKLKKANNIFFNKDSSKLIINFLKKKNEKVFIFGSGPSINDLTEKNFKEINKYTSIGVSRWIFHDFIPTFYMIELSYDEKLNEKYRLRILSILKNKKKKPLFLVYNTKSNPSKIRNWMRGMSSTRVFLYEYIRPDIFKKNFGYHFLKSLKYLSEESKKSNLITLGIGSTIERSISLSLLLGYSKIVILGVDLKNSKYFWTGKEKNFLGLKNFQKKNTPHKTAIKRFGDMPVQKSILILDKVARQHFNSKILISTNKSLLSSNLEKYKWKN